MDYSFHRDQHSSTGKYAVYIALASMRIPTCILLVATLWSSSVVAAPDLEIERCDTPSPTDQFFGKWSSTGEWRAPVLLLSIKNDRDGILIAAETIPEQPSKVWVGDLTHFSRDGPRSAVVRFESKDKDGGVVALHLVHGDCAGKPRILMAALKSDETRSAFFGPFQTDTGFNLFFPEHMILLNRGDSALSAMESSIEAVRKELRRHGG